MRDNIEVLLQNSLKPQLSPPPELNLKILEGAMGDNGTISIKTKAIKKVAKAAILTLAVFGLATASVTAATSLYQRLFVTEAGLVYGDEEDVEIFLDYDENEVITPTEREILTDVGDDTVKWYEKVVTQNGEDMVLNEYYYENYEDMIEDAMVDEWLPEEITMGECNMAVLTVFTAPGEVYSMFDVCIDARISYECGEIYISETWSRGTNRDPDDYGYNVYIPNPVNTRTYTNKNGRSFTLVDEADGLGRTFTSLFYPVLKMGYISFENLTEDQIYEVLDQFVEPHVEDKEFIFPEKPGVEPIVNPLKISEIPEVEHIVTPSDDSEIEAEDSEIEPPSPRDDLANWNYARSLESIAPELKESNRLRETTLTINKDSSFEFRDNIWVGAGSNVDIVVEEGSTLYLLDILDVEGSFEYEPGGVLALSGSIYLKPNAVLRRGNMVIEVERLSDEEVEKSFRVEAAIADRVNYVIIRDGLNCKIKISGISREEFDELVIVNDIFHSAIIELNGEDITDTLTITDYES